MRPYRTILKHGRPQCRLTLAGLVVLAVLALVLGAQTLIRSM